MTLRILATLLVATGLSACGGGGGGDTATAPSAQSRTEAASVVAERTAAFRNDVRAGTAQRQLLERGETTSLRNMPTSGSATFDGYASLLIAPRADDRSEFINVVGDSNLRARFGAGTLTGKITDMRANRGSNPLSGPASKVNGEIRLGGDNSASDRNSRIDGNDWAADYRGTLGIEGETYTTKGILSGSFIGRPGGTGGAQFGIVGNSENRGTARLNGRNLPSNLAIVGTAKP